MTDERCQGQGHGHGHGHAHGSAAVRAGTRHASIASAHLMVAAEGDTHAVLDQAQQLLADRDAVTHATLQVDPDHHTGCNEISW